MAVEGGLFFLFRTWSSSGACHSLAHNAAEIPMRTQYTRRPIGLRIAMSARVLET